MNEPFDAELTCRPYIVRERSWRAATQAEYARGGALGFKDFGVASLCPGYDHHAVPGRDHLVVDRRGGNFYRENWDASLSKATADRATILMVETWNKLHEGTNICDSVEYGRQYVEMTAEFEARFKASG